MWNHGFVALILMKKPPLYCLARYLDTALVGGGGGGLWLAVFFVMNILIIPNQQ
jgi:hypothetical protein